MKWRPDQRLLPAGLFLAGLLLAGLAGAAGESGASPPAGSEPPEPPDRSPSFALGWQDGVTVHWRCAGPWFVEAAAGPDDLLLEVRRTEWDPAVTAPDFGRPEVVDDDKREMGWARLAGGRRVARRGEWELSALAGLRYQWENTQDRGEWWDRTHDQYWMSRSQVSVDDWLLFLAARPALRLHRRVTVGFDVGFAYAWSSRYETTTTVRPWLEEDARSIRTYRQQTGGGRVHGGWNGLGSLHFRFWF